MGRRRSVAAAVAAILLASPGVSAVAGDATAPSSTRAIVFAAEENRLNAYDATSGAKQTVIPNFAAGGLDINAQICFHRWKGATYFIAGEDTGQEEAGSPGWGWFELTGDEIGALRAVQRGKLRPEWSPHAGDQAENYGCGFVDEHRMVTTDVGDQLPHQAASGQLVLWYLDPETGFNDATDDDGETHTIDNRLDSNYCKIDVTIGTAGGAWVDGDWVYVAANRPGPNGPGGIYRYRIADFPADASCNGHRREDPLADVEGDGAVERELWLPSDAWALTPSALVPTGRTWRGYPTWYVSSVFNGVIAEYADTGSVRVHVRNVVEPPAGLPIGQADDLPGNDGGTPFGVGVTPDGDLWYADLGIQGGGPAEGHGSVQRVAVDSQGNVIHRAVVDDGLTYPDGIGILVVEEATGTGGQTLRPRDAATRSGGGCEWGMYGQGPSRAFAVPAACESPISQGTAPALVPKWFVKTDRVVTASPAVAGGRVFVGDWSGTMYAVAAETGDVLWTFDTKPAVGAAFGPIVSSAAVASVQLEPGSRRAVVYFGAGPRLYALDAATGKPVWALGLDGRKDTPVEIESSPVVWQGIVYVGIDTHNRPDTGVPGGLLAVDAATGKLLGKFEPELGADEGCGGVWSSPVINEASDPALVYLATANCPHDVEWTRHVEAVTALDARTLEVVWSYQPHEPNRRDEDFGATANLFKVDGRLVLGIGNKDGTYYALDARTGDLVWRTQVAEPGNVRDDFAIGGFIGSTAVWGGHVFGATAIGGPPSYHSLDGSTGAVRWRGAQAPSYAASAIVNGVTFSGALDSVLRAYDTATGAVLWASPLAGPISSGPAIVGSSVYVGSGTSSSDACAKELPVNEQCQSVFEQVLGSLGGIHAFQLAGSS